MRKLFAAALIAAAFFSVPGSKPANAQQMVCLTKEQFEVARQRIDERKVFEGVTANGLVFMVYANLDTGQFTVFLTDGDRYCAPTYGDGARLMDNVVPGRAS